MSELHFYYGTMASAKSGRLLMTCHQYTECGTQCILLKPSSDTRFKAGHITSRAVQSKPCLLIESDTNIHDIINEQIKPNFEYICVFVDEVQFLKPEQIKQLWEISHSNDKNIDVFCYGLKTTYLNTLFDSSKELLIYADYIECLPSMCSFCHNKATTHLRFVKDEVVTSGNVQIIGDVQGNVEYYKSVCQDCYNKAIKQHDL